MHWLPVRTQLVLPGRAPKRMGAMTVTGRPAGHVLSRLFRLHLRAIWCHPRLLCVQLWMYS